MRRAPPFLLALAIGLAALVLISPSRLAKAAAEDTTLSLTTDYLLERVAVAQTPFGGHWLRLQVTLENTGNGEGRLEIDPNIQGYNEFGDPSSVTEIATFALNVAVEAVKLQDPAKKGRRRYELKGEKLTTRLFLVVSPPEVGLSRLIVQSKEKTDVIPLKDAGRPK